MADREVCLRCNRSVAFEPGSEEPTCPECGWGKKAAAHYRSEQTREARRKPYRTWAIRAGWALLVGLVVFGSISAPSASNRGLGAFVGMFFVLLTFVGIPYSIWLAWQHFRDKTRPEAKRDFASTPARNPSTASASAVKDREVRLKTKQFRAWVFFSIAWALAVFLFVAWVDPYNNGSWDYMDAREWVHMLSIMLVPPLLVGGGKWVWDQWVE